MADTRNAPMSTCFARPWAGPRAGFGAVGLKALVGAAADRDRAGAADAVVHLVDAAADRRVAGRCRGLAVVAVRLALMLALIAATFIICNSACRW